MKYDYSFTSEIGQKRESNEDSIGIYKTPKGLLLIVCDGVGGNKAGEIASSISVEAIHKIFTDSKLNDPLEIIKEAILGASHLIEERAKKNHDFLGMATTAEALYLSKDTAYWGHIGDSRIYFWKNGKLKRLTKDHSLVQKLIDEGHLTLKEAENHPNKNIIMKALGSISSSEIDLSKQKLNSKDDFKFFICTDGVTEVVSDSEIEEILKMKKLAEINLTLKNLIEERGAPDNYSFVIIDKISKW